jgi:chromosome segregation ATPase
MDNLKLLTMHEYNHMQDQINKLLNKISRLEDVIEDKILLLESAYESSRKFYKQVENLHSSLEEKNALLDSYQNQVKDLESQLAAQEVISQALLTQLMLKTT